MPDNPENRPDPDLLLNAISKQAEKSSKGRLKIFFGMCAGVGKTYAMLSEARELKKSGVDVVIGYVETHNRPETDALAHSLPVIPRISAKYKGMTLEEMDVREIINRRPKVALVDELAHSNAPGSMHSKRWQDAVELLNAGIDVFATVNVQHIESRRDTVKEITGITVKEMVPDSIIDMADEIELVDISTEELLKRFAEGKVYLPEKAGVAARNFFRVGNLTALREMSLRVTAERVDSQLREYMRKENISGPWKSGERLMVGVSSSPYSASLIRWTRRLAYTMKARWFAVHIDTGVSDDDAANERLSSNIALAKELGAVIINAADTDIVRGILRIARQNNVSQLIIGKPVKRNFKDLIGKKNLVDRLIRESGDIDVYAVRAEENGSAGKNESSSAFKSHSSIKQYLLVGLFITLVAALCFPLRNYIGYQSVGLIMLFSVILLPLFANRGPILLAGLLSASVWNFFFIPPLFTFHINTIHDVITLCLNFSVAIISGFLTARIRDQEQTVRQREERAVALYNLADELSHASSKEKVIEIAISQIEKLFDSPTAFLLPGVDGKLRLAASSRNFDYLDSKELTVAEWSFERKMPAGKFTDNIPSSKRYYTPVATPRGAIGVVALDIKKRLTLEREAVLNNYITQIASAYEREISEESSRKFFVDAESEKLYKTFINSVSHEFRTPIAIIHGASSGLQDDATIRDPAAVKDLSGEILAASKRMDRLVENLLNATRIESGTIRFNPDWVEINDVVISVINNLEYDLKNHKIAVNIEGDLPFIKGNYVLISQALANVVQNAAFYSAPGTAIKISAYYSKEHVCINVEDQGGGIPESELERIFDKFYRLPGVKAGGAGLGLSISRGFIEAHGGSIRAENSEEGGARFIITLPCEGELFAGNISEE
ncbi:MAG: ATP-binding protein [Chloroflexota bacterium]